MSKTINNSRSSQTVNGSDLSTTITALQTATTNLNSNIIAITTVLNGDQAEIDNIENMLLDVAKTTTTNNFTSTNTFTSIQTGTVPSLNNDLTNKLYVDSAVFTKVALTGAQTIAGVKTFSDIPILPNNTISQSNVTNGYADLSSAQTIGGIKTFSQPPVLSGASISTNTINDNSLSSNVMLKTGTNNVAQNNVTNGYCDLTSAQTIAGIKTFSSIPVLPNNTITQTKVTNGYADLTSAQTIAGIKTFSNIPVLPNNTISQNNVTNGYADLSSAQTISGIKTFSQPPVLSGASISSNTINDGSLSSNVMLKTGTNNVAQNNVTNGYCDLSTTQTIAGIKTFSNIPVLPNNTISQNNVTNGYADLSSAQTISGIKTFSQPPVLSGASISNLSIPDSALSTNIPKLNVENIFSGLRVNGQAYFNTLAPAIPACTLDSQATNKLYVDTALNLKANVLNPTFSGTATFTNPPTMSGANISNLSIPDSALSVNIPKLNSSSNNFTGGMSIRNATIGSENMAQTNTITGNTNIGSSNTNDVVNYIGKHNFSNSATDSYKFNSLTCNGYSYFNTRPPECPIQPENDNSLTNKNYVDQLVVTSRSQPFLYTWSFGVGRAGASIVNNSLSTAENANRTIYMHIPTGSVALVFPFSVTFNYFHVYANQNQTVPATNPTLSFQTTFSYLYSQLNNTLYKTRETGNTNTASNQTFTSNSVNYTYKPLEITAFEGATGKKGVMFKIGLPQMPNTASNGNYIMAFSSSLRIENSYSDDQFGTGRTTNDFIYPSTDSKNEQGSVYFSYVAV